MLIGPHASKAELAEFRERLKADPANYIGQPTIELSAARRCATPGVQAAARRSAPVRPDRPRTWVLPGGLTRVALRPGSLVVNSSQGGGSKDTWVLA